MKYTQLLTITATLALTCGSVGQLQAADNNASQPTQEIVASNPATQRHIDAKADRLLAAIKLENSPKAARVKTIMGKWFVTMWNWQKQHNPELNKLWAQWAKARSVKPKDDFPGEVVAQKIKHVYASLKPAYHQFIAGLSTELTPEQINKIKDTWSHKPGMMRTYKVYLQIVPDLTPAQKKVIYDQLRAAREESMLTDSSRDIVNIYKCHKVKIQAYIGTIEWHKLYSAFVHRIERHEKH